MICLLCFLFVLMFAVFETGGKQYKVSVGDILRVEKISENVGDSVSFDSVMMMSSEAVTSIGKPFVSGVKVVAEVLEHFKDKKVIVFKKVRRHNYRRKKGHRQELSLLKIKEILV